MYALLAALANVGGALVLSRGATRGVLVIEHSVAFGAGFMLAVAITEILPEALRTQRVRQHRRSCWQATSRCT